MLGPSRSGQVTEHLAPRTVVGKSNQLGEDNSGSTIRVACFVVAHSDKQWVDCYAVDAMTMSTSIQVQVLRLPYSVQTRTRKCGETN